MFNREGTTVLVDSTVPDNISPVAYCPDNSWQQWLVLNFRTRKDCLVDGKRCLASTTLQTSISHTRSIWTPIHSQEGLGQTGSSVSVPRRFLRLREPGSRVARDWSTGQKKNKKIRRNGHVCCTTYSLFLEVLRDFRPIASLDPEKVYLTAFSILSPMFTGACQRS